MSAPSQSGGEPVTRKAQLVRYMERGCKPRDAWHIGTEHEKFAYSRADYRPLPYKAEQEVQPSIRALLEGMQRFDWEPVLEAGRVIALDRKGTRLNSSH